MAKTNDVRLNAASDAVLAALDSLQHSKRRASVADLRDRLLQMGSSELDERLLALEREGRLRLHAVPPGEGTLRDRTGSVVHPRRGLLGYATRVRGERRHREQERILTLNVRVPAKLLEALDRYVSVNSRTERANGASRAAVARDLLERILDRQADDRRVASLRAAILSAIAEETSRTGTATLHDVRQRLAAIPQDELDRALLSLEARGALVLAPAPEGAEGDARAALWCAARGPLSCVQLPSRGRTARKRRMGRTG